VGVRDGIFLSTGHERGREGAKVNDGTQAPIGGEEVVFVLLLFQERQKKKRKMVILTILPLEEEERRRGKGRKSRDSSRMNPETIFTPAQPLQGKKKTERACGSTMSASRWQNPLGEYA